MAEITVTISDDLLDAYTWFQGVNGANWAGAYVDGKLVELKERKYKLEKEDMRKKYDKLNAADKAAVAALLAKGK